MLKVLFTLIVYLTNIEVSLACMKDAILTHVKEKLAESITGQEFDVKLNSFNKALEKASTEGLELTTLNLDDNQRHFNGIITLASGQHVKISGRVEFQTELPVLKRLIKAGDVIEEADIAWMKYATDRITTSMVTSKADLIGKTARSGTLKTNTPIQQNTLQKPLVIRRGETVQVTYKSQSFAVSNVAKAQGEGGVGDMIALEVTSQGDSQNPRVVKKKIIHAKIVGPAMAEIVRAA